MLSVVVVDCPVVYQQFETSVRGVDEPIVQTKDNRSYHAFQRFDTETTTAFQRHSSFQPHIKNHSTSHRLLRCTPLPPHTNEPKMLRSPSAVLAARLACYPGFRTDLPEALPQPVHNPDPTFLLHHTHLTYALHLSILHLHLLSLLSVLATSRIHKANILYASLHDKLRRSLLAAQHPAKLVPYLTKLYNKVLDAMTYALDYDFLKDRAATLYCMEVYHRVGWLLQEIGNAARTVRVLDLKFLVTGVGIGRKEGVIPLERFPKVEPLVVDEEDEEEFPLRGSGSSWCEGDDSEDSFRKNARPTTKKRQMLFYKANWLYILFEKARLIWLSGKGKERREKDIDEYEDQEEGSSILEIARRYRARRLNGRDQREQMLLEVKVKAMQKKLDEIRGKSQMLRAKAAVLTSRTRSRGFAVEARMMEIAGWGRYA